MVSVVPAWVDTNILSLDVRDPISASSITTYASLDEEPVALRLGAACRVNAPSVLDVEPVWNLTNSFAVGPVATVLISTTPKSSAAVTVDDRAALIAETTLAAVIVPERLTVV